MDSEEKNLIETTNIEQQQIITNLQYPTTVLNFEALHSAVNDHYKGINNREKSKIPNSQQIKNKEQFENKFQCIKEITKHTNRAKKITEEKKIFHQLNAASKTVVVTKKNGKKLFIETLETSQAKQFMELFISLKRNDLGKDKRIELLLKLQETLEEFKETDLTKPVIDLLKRELTLLKDVQLNDDQLKMLRKRIEINVQWILKQPEINPAIAKLSKPVNLIKCYNCSKLKTLDKFDIKSDLIKMTTCKDCKYLHQIIITQINLTPYQDILKNIKIAEAELCATSSIAYVFSKEDVYYLVTMIWKGKSAISESKNLIHLRLVRWDNKRDWSPSNTILLTVQEAYDHSKIQNINSNYAKTFIESVNVKHIIAKKYFKDIIERTLECDLNIKRQKHMNNT